MISTLSILKLSVVVLVLFVVQYIILTLKAKEITKYSIIVVLNCLVLYAFLRLNIKLVPALIVCAISFALSFVVSLFGGNGISSNKSSKKPWTVIFPTTAGNLIIKNIKRGLVIFGSAGSGKTESCFVPIIKHCADNDIPSLIYDYKNGELTEIASYFYDKTNIKKAIIIPHNPNFSDRVNPFHPKYIPTEQHLRQLTKLIFANLKKAEGVKDGVNSFFDKIPEPTLASVIWRLKVDYPEFCTLPHAVALCLTKTPEEIANFASKNPYSYAISAPLRDSLESTDQVSGVKASLSLPLTDLALPSIFWVMSANEVDLDLNNPDNPTLLCVLNDPQLPKANAPFISVIISTIINSMQVRNRPPSYLLFDEGTTFFIDGISSIPATMRSYNIATVFSTQDKALARENYGDTITSSLLANLSYQMIGKANDPESVKYYKSISEEIEKKTISKSFSNDFLKADSRTSESTRETSKFKNQDFTRLREGQFFVFSDGRERKYDFKLIPFQRVSLKQKQFLTQKEINDNFNNIFSEVTKLV